MKLPTRLLITALVSALALPIAAFAAKGEKKKKNDTPAANFATMDKDSDGFVSEAEFIAATKGSGTEEAAKTKFSSLDKDQNGKLSRDEVAAAGKGKKGKKKKKDQ